MTAAATFLNTAFSGLDSAILSALYSINNPVLTAICKIITLIGEKGIVFFLAAVVMMLFPKTRRIGICLFGAVACGALITNIILKDMVARPRPLDVAPFRDWWKAANLPAEDDFSFPSGHATAAAAGMVAIWLNKGKKWAIPSVVWILLTMFARNYLLAHYPSDVVAGVLIGTVSAFIAWSITSLIYKILWINRGKPWADFIRKWGLLDFAGIPSKLGLIDSGRSSGAGTGEAVRRAASSVKSAAAGAAKSAAGKVAPPEPRIDTYRRSSNRQTADYRGRHAR